MAISVPQVGMLEAPLCAPQASHCRSCKQHDTIEHPTQLTTSACQRPCPGPGGQSRSCKKGGQESSVSNASSLTPAPVAWAHCMHCCCRCCTPHPSALSGAACHHGVPSWLSHMAVVLSGCTRPAAARRQGCVAGHRRCDAHHPRQVGLEPAVLTRRAESRPGGRAGRSRGTMRGGWRRRPAHV